MSDPRQERLVRNEEAFREINEQVEQRVEHWEELDAAYQNVVCECSDADCAQSIPLTPREYRMVRSSDRRFAVAPRHDEPEIERVVYRHSRYWVVEKLV